MTKMPRIPIAKPRPADGNAIWSKMAPRAAFIFLAAWAVAWLLEAVLGDGVASTRLVWIHVGFGGIGFAGNLVVGLGFRLDAMFHQRPFPPTWMQRGASLAMSLGAGAVSWQAWYSLPRFNGIIASLGGIALATSFALVLLAAVRQASATHEVDARYVRGDRASDFLSRVALIYGALAGASSIYFGVVHPATVHLFLAGFITTTIYAVSHRLVARFSNWEPPSKLIVAQASLATIGPALLAWGVANPSHYFAAAGASLEFLAALLYAILLGIGWGHRRNKHPALPLMFLGSLFALNGMLFGLAFLAHAELRIHLILHAINNLVGFVSITILGAGSAMIGTAVRPIPGKANRYVWYLAALISAPLILWEIVFTLQLPGQEILFLTVLGVGIHAWLGLKAIGFRH